LASRDNVAHIQSLYTILETPPPATPLSQAQIPHISGRVAVVTARARSLPALAKSRPPKLIEAAKAAALESHRQACGDADNRAVHFNMVHIRTGVHRGNSENSPAPQASAEKAPVSSATTPASDSDLTVIGVAHNFIGSQLLRPGDDPATVARQILRSKQNPFNRRLDYPNLGIV
jgi:hypothetical protein